MSDENELIVLQPITAVAVFGKEGGSESVIDAIRKQVEALKLDISTSKGRDQIRSVARKIASTKIALDEEGKTLKSDMQKTVDLVDAERKKIRDALDEMKEQVRKPLTDWENAEKKRVQDREDRISVISSLVKFEVEPTVDHIQIRIDQLSELSSFDWQEFLMRASETISATKYELELLLASRIKYDQDQEELERLRKEQEELARKHREEQIAREAADKARKEAEEKSAAEAKAAQEKSDKEKREAAEREAAERKAKEDAIRAAEESEAKRKEDAERAEREKKEAVELAAREERERIEAERVVAASQAAAREADKKHKAKINNEVLTALLTVVTEIEFQNNRVDFSVIAKAIVIAIAYGKVPHTKISY